MSNPAVCVLKTDGVNCDREMSHAFEVTGADPTIVHVNELREGSRNLAEFAILALPGGFSYGDDIASGKILANELKTHLSDSLRDHLSKGRPVFGICNGFQVLTPNGLLPSGDLVKQTATLRPNDSGHFGCRWIDLLAPDSVCQFVGPDDFTETVPMQVAHGEGRFFASDEVLTDLAAKRQIVFQYASPDGSLAGGEYPDNPNGSSMDIAGICDPSGTILGMMPHPERSIAAYHPYRERTELARSAATTLFTNIVNYAKEL